MKTKDERERSKRPPDLRSPDVLWLELWQKMAAAFQHWQRCELPQCRRSRGCTADSVPIPCNRLFPRLPPMSNYERAAVADDFKQALNKRMAEVLREQAQRETSLVSSLRTQGPIRRGINETGRGNANRPKRSI